MKSIRYAAGHLLRSAMVLLAVLCLLPAGRVYAAGNFIIHDFDIDMTVNKDDTYLITETVDVEFTVPSHGIYVNIPLRTELDRDGQKSQYNAGINDFELLSGQPCTVKKTRTGFRAKIGDPDKYADTHTVYKYSYLYDTKGDHLKDADEVYHNLVGTTWEAKTIDHVSFRVSFPEDIDMSKVGIKTGKGVDIAFEAPDARTVTGETDESVLKGLTIRAVLPQGYFTREARNPVLLFYLTAGALALMAAAGYGMWRKYGRDPVYPVTEEFYPPDDLSAPEIAYLSKGQITNSNVISILFTLADKGYLRIREYEEDVGRKHKKVNRYEIIKLREYDGNTIGEKAFMEGLFAGGDSVNVKDLEDKFYKTAENIKKDIRNKYKGRLYDGTAAGKARIMYIAGCAGLIVLYAVSMITGNGLGSGGITITAGSIMAVGLGFYLISMAVKDKKSIGAFIGAAIPAAGGLIMSWLSDLFYGWQTIPFLTGMLFCLIVFIMGGLCERKTDYYARISARIRGFTDFLNTAEKDQLEALAEKDPGYYYRNLAFAFALGITAVYAQRFVSIARQSPDWYDTYHYYDGSFSPSVMAESFTHMADSVSSSMTSSPSDSSGGGSFSGGGGGGGSGGGSW